LVLQDGDDVIGFAHVSPARDDDVPATTGELTAIYVTRSAWGRGGGGLLMGAAQDRMREAGFGDAVLWVLEGNERARRFYEHQGWSADGIRKTDDRGAFVLHELRYRLTL
jgi:GNAT superfamily N-acetyltransferase